MSTGGLAALVPATTAAGPAASRRPRLAAAAGSRPKSRRPPGSPTAARSSPATARTRWATRRLYPATGWHIRGEMGGFWTPPVKLLDGMWFAVDGAWLGKDSPTTSYNRGCGLPAIRLPAPGGLRVERIDVVPDGGAPAWSGSPCAPTGPRTVTLAVDAHSELMSAYPWGWTTPSQATPTCPTPAPSTDGALVFRDTARRRRRGQRDYAAVVAGASARSATQLGPDHRGPQDPAVICPADRHGAAHAATTGRSARAPAAGSTYHVELARGPGRRRSGSPSPARTTASRDGPRRARHRAARPGRALATQGRPRAAAARTPWSTCPATGCCSRASSGASRTSPTPSRRPATCSCAPPTRASRTRRQGHGGQGPVARRGLARTTRGSSPPTASTPRSRRSPPASSTRQGPPAGAARRQRACVNDQQRQGGARGRLRTGRSTSAPTTTPGNTDETAKFPSTVALVWRWTGDDRFRDEMYDFAVRNMRYVTGTLDADGDGWPEGLGNVERPGMGEEKLDTTVYTDPRPARPGRPGAAQGRHRDREVGDRAGRRTGERGSSGRGGTAATPSVRRLARRPGRPGQRQHAMFQRHWIGLTPMEAELAARTAGRPLARPSTRRPRWPSGRAPATPASSASSTPAPGRPASRRQQGPVLRQRGVQRADRAGDVLAQHRHDGRRRGQLRPARRQQRRYTTGNARIQLDPSVWEMPGAMPEIAPSPGLRAPTSTGRSPSRSSVLQAWGAYGVLWPVVHQQLGVDPDLGRGRARRRAAGSRGAAADRRQAHRRRPGQRWTSPRRTRATPGARRCGWTVCTRRCVGAVLPADAKVAKVTVNGRSVEYTAVRTTRGLEIRVAAHDRAVTVEVTTK